MNLHILGFPFSSTTRDWSHCAFTDRTRVFAQMMTEQGFTTYLYGGPDNDAKVTEHVACISEDEQQTFWPDYVPKRDVFSDFDPESSGWRVFNARCVAEIHRRMEKHDVLCLTMGLANRPVAECFSDLFHVETGIGYSGVYAPYRVYESKAWMDFLVGKYGPVDDIKAFDAVIPRAYESYDFPAGDGSGDYALFVGRLISRKGPQIAALAAARAGVPLVVAGQGVQTVEPGRITCQDGTVLEGDVTYAGVLGPAARAEVMGKARCILTPTIYFEPFGGVSVEAQLCGTPAVVSNWGGLPENVEQGVTGFACSVLDDFTQAIIASTELDRTTVRDHAYRTWTTDVVGASFTRFLRRLATVPGQGWYAGSLALSPLADSLNQ